MTQLLEHLILLFQVIHVAIFKRFDCSFTVRKVIFLTAYSKDFDLLVTVLTVENAGFGTGCNYEEKEKL